MKNIVYVLLLGIGLLSCSDDDNFKEDNVDFDELELKENSYWDGSDGSGYFISGNMRFENHYNSIYDWKGFAYSNKEEILTLGIYNQYSAIQGGGKGNTENYAVVRCVDTVAIEFVNPDTEEIRGFFISNTTPNYFSMMFGYQNEKKFGGVDGNDPDWFCVNVRGIAASGRIIGEKKVFLADYRFDNSDDDFVEKGWPYVDVSEFGIIKRLEFTVASSDTDSDGDMITPPYFCIDLIRGRIY